MDDIGYVILQIFILLVFAKLLGAVFEKFKMPGLIGEILAGIIFINLAILFPDIFWNYLEFSVTDFEADETGFLHVMGELGIIFLLFTVGLETKFSDLMKVGKTAMYVAILGIIIPFLGGLMFVFWDGISFNTALLIGTAMFGMSTAITIECLRNLDAMSTTEAKIIVSASVIDDILCLTLLAVISGVVTPGTDTTKIIVNTIIVIAFVLFMFLYISKIKKIAERRKKKMLRFWRKSRKISGDLIVGPEVTDCHETKPMTELSALGIAVIVCLGMAALSSIVGLAGIIGAFLAGMMFAEFKDTIPCEHNFNVLTYFMLPFFFIWVGMKVQLDLVTASIIWLLIAMVVIAVATKYIAGYAGARMGKLPKDSSKLIGVSMIPRGEVGIIVATIGLTLAVFTPEMFTAIILMTIVTSMLTPPLVSHAYRKMIKNREHPVTDEPTV